MSENFDVGAFHAALDSQRLAMGLNWKDVAAEAGVSASTLTRMAQGKRPDVDAVDVFRSRHRQDDELARVDRARGDRHANRIGRAEGRRGHERGWRDNSDNRERADRRNACARPHKRRSHVSATRFLRVNYQRGRRAGSLRSARICDHSTCGSHGLVRYASQPASKAVSRETGTADTAMMGICRVQLDSCSRRIASHPLTRGIAKSMTMMSGSRSVAFDSAGRPSSAVKTLQPIARRYVE